MPTKIVAGREYLGFIFMEKIGNKTCIAKCKNCNKVKKMQICHLYRDKSCGCLNHRTGKNHPRWTGVEEIPGWFINRIEVHARDKNRCYNLDKQFLWSLFLKQNRRCAISGLEIGFQDNPTASLDRIDNTKGYTELNVQWLHKDVNKMKSIFKQDYLISLCKSIANYNEGC